MKERTYVCCDLKSFYASVECVERGLDPMTTNLVVADKRRTEKTICLAVTPSLKAYGISGRARLFEVVQRVAEVNAQRRRNAPGHQFSGSSWNDPEVRRDPSLELDYIVAPPRMANYIDWSTRIYQVYLKYIAPEDIYPYSIDEVFMDITDYLDTYKMTARELTRTIILDILKTTGITAAAGMGTNLYLAKVSMDIVAKHVHADKDGVRIAKLNEMTYRRLLWSHRPLTDFWRVGKGYAAKLEGCGLYTMGDIARCSIGKPTDYHNEELLYQLFGVNAELLIDHAWGWEPCTIADVKAYKPEHKSIVSGQVLQCPYTFEKARLVVREMADALALDLVDKGLATNQLVLTVGYDIENLSVENHRYQGPVTTDRYGRKIPKHAVGTENFDYGSAAETKDYERAIILIGSAWGLDPQNAVSHLELITREKEAARGTAEPEETRHVLPESELPMNASGMETLDNVCGLFETAIQLESRDHREALFRLASKLMETQNLLDWIEKTPEEQELPELAES